MLSLATRYYADAAITPMPLCRRHYAATRQRRLRYVAHDLSIIFAAASPKRLRATVLFSLPPLYAHLRAMPLRRCFSGR